MNFLQKKKLNNCLFICLYRVAFAKKLVEPVRQAMKNCNIFNSDGRHGGGLGINETTPLYKLISK